MKAVGEMDKLESLQRMKDLIAQAWGEVKCYSLLRCRECDSGETCPKDRVFHEAGYSFMDTVCSLLENEGLNRLMRNFFDKNYLRTPIIHPVRGTSMWPALKPGDLIILFPAGLLGLKEGDVVSYLTDSPGEIQAMHRIVRITGTGFVARGDHNVVKATENIPAQNVTKHLKVHIPTGSPLWTDLHRVFGSMILDVLQDALEETSDQKIVRWIKKRIKEEECDEEGNGKS